MKEWNHDSDSLLVFVSSTEAPSHDEQGQDGSSERDDDLVVVVSEVASEESRNWALTLELPIGDKLLLQESTINSVSTHLGVSVHVVYDTIVVDVFELWLWWGFTLFTFSAFVNVIVSRCWFWNEMLDSPSGWLCGRVLS